MMMQDYATIVKAIVVHLVQGVAPGMGYVRWNKQGR